MGAIVKITICNITIDGCRVVSDLHGGRYGIEWLRADTLSHGCRRAAKRPSRPVTAIVLAIGPDARGPTAIAVARRPSADIAPDGRIKRDTRSNYILSRLDSAGTWTVNIEQSVIRLC
jgi:hypothetical protein